MKTGIVKRDRPCPRSIDRLDANLEAGDRAGCVWILSRG